MRSKSLLLAATALGIAAACNSAPLDLPCTPNTTAACAGPGGCSGVQMCNAGQTYDPCQCPGVDASVADAAEEDATIDATLDTAEADSTADVSDAQDAAPEATVDAGPLSSPTMLSGLVLWLDGNAGITKDSSNNISAWKDQSGQGNDAVQGSNPPLFVSSAVNGHPAIKCNYGSLTIPDSSTLRFGTGDFAIALVAKMEFGNVNQPIHLYGKGVASGGVGIVDESFTALTFFDGYKSLFGSFLANSLTDTFGAVIARGVTMSITVDGFGSSGLTGTADVSMPGSDVILCLGGLSTSIAEVVVVKGTLSDTDAARLGQYFKTKFALN